MNPRDTVILAILVVALGAFLWFYEIGGEEERARAASASKRLFPELTADAIRAVELRTNDDHEARLERREEGWWLVEPVDFRADTLAADGLASTLAELTSEAVFEEPEPLIHYGLDVPPRVRIEVEGASHALRIGDKTPVGGNTYAATGEDDRVFAVPTWRITSLSKSLRDLRDARILRFDRDAVVELRARWPGEGVKLVRGEAGDWRLLAPIEGPADEAAVESLLSSLEFLRADAFDDDPGAEALRGLEEPAFDVELVLEGEPEPLRVVVGSTEDGLQRHVRGPASETTLYKISVGRLEDLPRSVSAYRWKTLARFASSDAARFEILFEGEAEPLRLTAERTETGWQTEPERLAPGRASRLVAELASLSAEDIAADAVGEAEAAALGLRPPRATLRVHGEAPEGEEGPLLAEVRLGIADPERGIAATRPDDPVVYWLAFALAEHLPLSADALRNRFLAAEGEEGPAATDPFDLEPDEDDAFWELFGDEAP